MEKFYRKLCVLLLMLSASTALIAQQRFISGVVQDEAGAPMPGVNVIIKGTTAGTATDVDGRFTLEIRDDQKTLVISAIGYLTQEIGIDDRTTFNIKLAPDVKTLQEVVVTGYSTQSKRDITGAVSSITGETVSKAPVADIGSALQGRIAGVTVDGQGGPGNNQVIRIRGIGTLGANDPLYVIDGVQTTSGINLINQNDIETLTVLKDAASCALYGARGSNGVIVITTKRGKTGAPKVEYNGYVGVEVPPKTPDIMSPQQYADAYWGFLSNSGQPFTSPLYGNGTTPVLPDYIVVNTTGTPFFGGVAANDPRADASNYNFNNYRIMEANKSGTDWFREVLKPARLQSHQLALSGATDKSNYALTFNYLDNQGILMNTFFKRYSMRVNTEFAPRKWFKVGENMQFSYAKQNTVSDHTDQNAIAGLFNTSPIMPVYDIAGNYTGTKGTQYLDGNNPVLSAVNSKNYDGYVARVMGSAYVEVEPLEGLIIQSKITTDFSPYQSYSWKGIYPQLQYDNGKNQFFETSGNSVEWRNTNKISYEKTFNDIHKITAFVAHEVSRYNTRYVYGQNDSLFSLSPGFLVLGTGAASTAKVSGGRNEIRYISDFGSVNYSLYDRYLASFTVRRDGSSKFGELKRFGVFPSASLGWRISGENFMKSATWIDDLKLRGSYGTSGNDASLPTGATINQYATNPAYFYYDLAGAGNTSMQGFALSQIGNPYLQWEVNKTLNLGFDATVLNGLTLGFNWFKRTTNKLLYQPPSSALQGDALKPYQNVMSFVNKGVELELGYNSKQMGKFHYNVNFNISTYRNEVTFIDGDPTTFINGDLYARQAVLSRSMVGHPVSSFYGYTWEGTFQTADEVTNHATQPGISKANPASALGHFKFKDINDDGVIDDKDRDFIDNPHPKFNYGLNVNLFYMDFDASIFFQGVAGNKIMNYWRTSYEWPGRYGVGSLDTWTPENTGAKLPIYDNNVSTLDAQSSTYFIENGSYLRLKSIQVGYTIKSLKGINNLRVYAQGFNMLTFTKYTGMNPEVNTGAPGAMGIDFGGNYPISQKYTIGVNLGF